MFSIDKNIDTLQDLIREIKEFLTTSKRYAKVELVSKLTALLSALILMVLLFALGAVVVLFLSYSLGLLLVPHVGTAMAFSIVAALYVLAALFVYVGRKKLIINPVAKFLINLFLTEKEDQADE